MNAGVVALVFCLHVKVPGGVCCSGLITVRTFICVTFLGAPWFISQPCMCTLLWYVTDRLLSYKTVPDLSLSDLAQSEMSPSEYGSCISSTVMSLFKLSFWIWSHTFWRVKEAHLLKSLTGKQKNQSHLAITQFFSSYLVFCHKCKKFPTIERLTYYCKQFVWIPTGMVWECTLKKKVSL